MKIKVCSLFSGIGGFEEGLYQALGRENVDIVFASEIDKFAAKTYELLHGHTPHGDITKISASDIPDHDLLVAGFPCQSFSIAGKRLGFQDEERGTLFFEIARILKEKKPTYILLENVKGLLNHDKGKTFEIIKNTLEDLGYTIHYKVLNSKNYGVPQNRERIFIVGKYQDPNFQYEFPKEQPLSIVIKDILEKEVDERFYLNEELHKRFVPKERKNEIIGVEGNRQPKIICINPRKEDGTQTYQQDRIYSEDGITPALCSALASLKIIIEQKIIQEKPFRLRKLTPLECFRIQGFPDAYYHIPKENGISNTQLYKMCGNAVSPPVIRAIIQSLFNS